MSADNTWNLLGSASKILATTILGNGRPAPSSSGVTFFQLRIQEPPFATACHRSRHNSSRPMHRSVSVLSNCCLAQLHSCQCKKSAPVRSRWPTKIPIHLRLANQLTPSSPTLRNQIFVQIAPMAFSIFVQFVSVRSFFHLHRFSSCDLSFKTVKPAE